MNEKVHRKIAIPTKEKGVIQKLERMLDDLITEIIALEEQNLELKKLGGIRNENKATLVD